MFKDINALREDRNAIVARGESIIEICQEENRVPTAEEKAEIDGQESQLKAIDADIERLEKIEQRQKQKIVKNRQESSTGQVFAVPMSERARGSLKAFRGPDAEREAYIAGQFALAVLKNREASYEFLSGIGINVQAAMGTDDNTKGGFTVPDILEPTIIRLVEERGVVRRNIGMVWPMPHGSISVPKRYSGFTHYYTAENNEITASDAALSQIQLVARDGTMLSRVSNKLFEQTISSLGDWFVTELAYCKADAEDKACFIGDGTSTYGGILGLKGALQAGAIVTTEANDNTLAEVTIAPVHEAMGKRKIYDTRSEPKWFMHNSVWENGFKRLAFAAGGNTAVNFEAGMKPMFMGYPVEFVQVMPQGGPTTDLATEIVAYFGSLSEAVAMGDARGLTIASSSERYFEYDQTGIRGTHRFDLNVHDRGDATTAGSIVGIKMATA